MTSRSGSIALSRRMKRGLGILVCVGHAARVFGNILESTLDSVFLADVKHRHDVLDLDIGPGEQPALSSVQWSEESISMRLRGNLWHSFGVLFMCTAPSKVMDGIRLRLWASRRATRRAVVDEVMNHILIQSEWKGDCCGLVGQLEQRARRRWGEASRPNNEFSRGIQ